MVLGPQHTEPHTLKPTWTPRGRLWSYQINPMSIVSGAIGYLPMRYGCYVLEWNTKSQRSQIQRKIDTWLALGSYYTIQLQSIWLWLSDIVVENHIQKTLLRYTCLPAKIKYYNRYQELDNLPFITFYLLCNPNLAIQDIIPYESMLPTIFSKVEIEYSCLPWCLGALVLL